MRDNAKGLGLGIFLLSIGIVWILSNAHIVTISTLYALLILWPLILIALGIGVIFRKNVIIRLITWIALLAAIISYGYFVRPDAPKVLEHIHLWTYDERDDIDNPPDNEPGANMINKSVSYEKRPEIEKCNLKLDMGATSLTVDSMTDNLFDASFGQEVEYSKSEDSNSKKATIRVKSGSIKLKNLDALEQHKETESVLHLNKDVIWNIDLDTGVMDGVLNLSDIIVQEMKVDTGLSKLRIYFGSCDTKIDMDAGLSDIEFVLPKDAGIRIKLDGAMNSTNFDEPGWTKEDGWSYSPDYRSKAYKIEAKIDLSMGKLKVRSSDD